MSNYTPAIINEKVVNGTTITLKKLTDTLFRVYENGQLSCGTKLGYRTLEEAVARFNQVAGEQA